MITLLDKDLEARMRAIANWKKIRILLVLLKMCGGNHQQVDNAHEEKV